MFDASASYSPHAMASRSYARIVAEYRRTYKHTVTVPNGGDWRDEYLSRAHYVATRGPLVQWFEDGRSVFGFATAEQAAHFQRWVDTCGIDWLTGPRDGPIPDFDKPPEPPFVTPGYSGHSGGPASQGMRRSPR